MSNARCVAVFVVLALGGVGRAQESAEKHLEVLKDPDKSVASKREAIEKLFNPAFARSGTAVVPVLKEYALSKKDYDTAKSALKSMTAYKKDAAPVLAAMLCGESGVLEKRQVAEAFLGLGEDAEAGAKELRASLLSGEGKDLKLNFKYLPMICLLKTSKDKDTIRPLVLLTIDYYVAQAGNRKVYQDERQQTLDTLLLAMIRGRQLGCEKIPAERLAPLLDAWATPGDATRHERDVFLGPITSTPAGQPLKDPAYNALSFLCDYAIDHCDKPDAVLSPLRKLLDPDAKSFSRSEADAISKVAEAAVARIKKQSGK